MWLVVTILDSTALTISALEAPEGGSCDVEERRQRTSLESSYTSVPPALTFDFDMI